MMSWIIIALVSAFLWINLFTWWRTKAMVLSVREKHQEKFFDLANELVDSGELSNELKDKLSRLSTMMGKFIGQVIAMQALKEVERDERSDRGKGIVRPVVDPHRDLDPKLKTKWRVMYFHWLIATCAQGSAMGASALLQFVNTMDPEETGARTESKLELSSLLKA